MLYPRNAHWYGALPGKSNADKTTICAHGMILTLSRCVIRKLSIILAVLIYVPSSLPISRGNVNAILRACSICFSDEKFYKNTAPTK